MSRLAVGVILQKLLIAHSEHAAVVTSLAVRLLPLPTLIIRLAQLPQPQPELHGAILQIALDKGVLIPLNGGDRTPRSGGPGGSPPDPGFGFYRDVCTPESKIGGRGMDARSHRSTD